MFIAIIKLVCPVGLAGRLAVVEIRRRGRVPGVAEAVRHVDDVRSRGAHHSWITITRPAPVGRVAVTRAAVAREADHRTHDAHVRPAARRRLCTGTTGRPIRSLAPDLAARAYANDRAHVFHSWSAQGAARPARRRRSRGLAVLGRRRATLPRLLEPAGQRQHRPPAPEAGRRDQGAGRPAVHGRAVPRQRRRAARRPA